MGITSYAQNFEDVILWRALGHVQNGTYVDIGAHHPEIDSVSKAFYDRGWRGVHVEPGPVAAQLLRDSRPGEMVIQAIVSDNPGVRAFYETPGGGLSTADKEVATFHAEQGHAPVSATAVVSISLDDVLGQVLGDEIHWLKIDVEGFERQVLLSWQTSRQRPWIVVIEATWPKTQISTHDQWEGLIVNKGYEFAYEDGLNRYYVSQDHQELRQCLGSPPNVFDEFQLNPGGSSAFLQEMKAFSEQQIAARTERIAQLETELTSARAELDRVESDRAKQTTLYALDKEHWERATLRAETIVSRLVDRETDIAHLQQFAADARPNLERLGADAVELDKRVGLIAEDFARQMMVRDQESAHRAQRLDQLGWQIEGLASEMDQLAATLTQHANDQTRMMLGYRRSLARLGEVLGEIVKGVDRLAAVTDDRRVPWPLRLFVRTRTDAGAIALSRHLALPDDEFLRESYRIILGREVDVDGLVYYGAKLAQGYGRPNVLADVVYSREARERATGGDLIELADDAFVEAAYFRELGRAPDLDGECHYNAFLAAGNARADLLMILRNSAEGRHRRCGIRDEIDRLARAVRSPFRWRTWFRPLPTTVFARELFIQLSECQFAADESLDEPDAGATSHGGSIARRRSDVGRSLHDKMGLLFAAVEGIGGRR